MISFNLKILAGRVGEKLKLRTKFKEDLRKIDEKWRDMIDAKERKQREEKIRARGRADHLWSWMDEKKKEYGKPDWELFKERVLVFPPEERLMYLTRWRQLAEADERERNWIDKMRKHEVSDGILFPHKAGDIVEMTEQELRTKPWYKEWHDGQTEDIVRTPRMTAREVREAMEKTYPIPRMFVQEKEGNMTDLVNIYKVVRKTPIPYIFESALTGVRDGKSRIIYPLGQIVADQLDGVGIFGYKKYEDARDFSDWLEAHELHLGQTVVMKAKGKILNADLPNCPAVLNRITRGEGVLALDDTYQSWNDEFVLCSELAIIEPALNTEGACWTEWEKPKQTYGIGDRILIDEREFLLAQVDVRVINLISIEDGNRWSGSKEVEDVNKITHEELDGLMRQSSTDWEWHKKE